MVNFSKTFRLIVSLEVQSGKTKGPQADHRSHMIYHVGDLIAPLSLVEESFTLALSQATSQGLRVANHAVHRLGKRAAISYIKLLGILSSLEFGGPIIQLCIELGNQKRVYGDLYSFNFLCPLRFMFLEGPLIHHAYYSFTYYKYSYLSRYNRKKKKKDNSFP